LREFDDLLIQDKQTLTRSDFTSSQAKKKGSASTKELYKRTRYWQYASDRKAAFAELYQFCFTLAKPP
jgi:DCN1-like protein 4/5